MADLIEVWRKPRMMISIWLSALFYAALTIPFKGEYLIPGIAEIRPSAFVPVLSSFIFGPAGAWGSAFGNLLGDLFGTFTYASLFGFAGNLFLGYLPYKIWFHLFRRDRRQMKLDIESPRDMLSAFASGIIANLFCAMIIAWGVYWILEKSYLEVWLVVFFNNNLALIFLWPALKWLLPLCDQYELSWFSATGDKRLDEATPTRQFYMLLTVILIVSGTVLTLASSVWEAALYIGNPWYRPSQLAVFWFACLHAIGAGYFSLKD